MVIERLYQILIHRFIMPVTGMNDSAENAFNATSLQLSSGQPLSLTAMPRSGDLILNHHFA